MINCKNIPQTKYASPQISSIRTGRDFRAIYGKSATGVTKQKWCEKIRQRMSALHSWCCKMSCHFVSKTTGHLTWTELLQNWKCVSRLSGAVLDVSTTK